MQMYSVETQDRFFNFFIGVDYILTGFWKCKNDSDGEVKSLKWRSRDKK